MNILIILALTMLFYFILIPRQQSVEKQRSSKAFIRLYKRKISLGFVLVHRKVGSANRLVFVFSLLFGCIMVGILFLSAYIPVQIYAALEHSTKPYLPFGYVASLENYLSLILILIPTWSALWFGLKTYDKKHLKFKIDNGKV